MIKRCEEYLFCELDKKEDVWEESLTEMEYPILGVFPLQVLPQDIGVVCFWNRKNKIPLQGKLTGKDSFLHYAEKLLELLQQIKEAEHYNLNGVILEMQAIFYDETEQIYLPVLPVREEGDQWEERLAELLREFMVQSGVYGTELGKSIEVLLQGRIVAPENLNRNLQLMVKKQEEAENRKTTHTVSTEELDWQQRMKKRIAEETREHREETAPAANGVFVRQKKESVPEETQERVVSGRLHIQTEENIKKDTQVLRQNMLGKGKMESTGFSSVAPVQLNQTNREAAGNLTDPFSEKQLHFVSFGMSQKVDLPITKSYFIIGKLAAQVDGVISYIGTISRMHCAIRQAADGIYIEDLGSANGTFVNEKKLEPYEGVKITTKDVIRLAQEKFAITYK